MSNVSSDLEFLHFVHKLKHLDRTGWVLCGIPKPESVASHMYRMSIMSAFLIDDKSIDMNKCLRMSIAHDLGESIIGDITPHDGVDDKTKHEKEVAAVAKLSNLVGGMKGEEILNLFKEYEDCSTPEAKLVRDLDKFDMILQAYEYELELKKPKFLQEFFDSTQGIFEHPKVVEWVQKLLKLREENVPFSF